jgi:hypothetical protein
MQGYHSQIGLLAGSPVIALHRFMETSNTAGMAAARTVIFKTLMALRAWCEGRNISKLVVKTEDSDLSMGYQYFRAKRIAMGLRG